MLAVCTAGTGRSVHTASIYIPGFDLISCGYLLDSLLDPQMSILPSLPALAYARLAQSTANVLAHCTDGLVESITSL